MIGAVAIVIVIALSISYAVFRGKFSPIHGRPQINFNHDFFHVIPIE